MPPEFADQDVDLVVVFEALKPAEGEEWSPGFPDLPILEVSLRTGVRVRDLNDTRRK
jgi:hypothetical protein